MNELDYSTEDPSIERRSGYFISVSNIAIAHQVMYKQLGDHSAKRLTEKVRGLGNSKHSWWRPKCLDLWPKIEPHHITMHLAIIISWKFAWRTLGCEPLMSCATGLILLGIYRVFHSRLMESSLKDHNTGVE